MKVLSLFDGMSCGQIALTELGVKIEKYYASEIDSHAIKQTQLNFPETIQLGDVTKWQEWNIEWDKINLILAGSPCQGFSFAGKQLAFNDPRSKLFFVFVVILHHCKKHNPDVKFLLENVNMKKDHLRIISEYVGVFPVNINSNLVSAQNRYRWYWTNILTKKVGLFNEVYVFIPQPQDRGILLKDILESEVDEKYFISKRVYENIIGQVGMSIFKKSKTQRNSTGRCLDEKHNYQIINLDGKEKPNQDKASCFTAGAHSGGNHSDMDLICVAMRGRNPDNLSDRRTGSPTQQRLEPKTDGKTNCLTIVQKDNLVFTYNQDKPVNIDNDKYNCLRANPGGKLKGVGIDLNSRIRRLTPTECSRLQTIPAWYKWQCSDTQQYRMLGSGWTVEVIKHILKFL